MKFVALVLAAPLVSAFVPKPFHAPVSRRVVQRGAMEMRTPIMAGNWKMNPGTLEDAVALAKGVGEIAEDSDRVEIVVTPPYPFLGVVHEALKGTKVKMASQGCFFEEKGAYTGAVAVSMVESVGCDYVLAGHSERRTLFKDDDGAINRKVKKILETKMGCILCIGESLEEYEAGLVNAICSIQLAKDLAGVTKEEMERVVIAYEPVWAIGTGLTCPSDVAQEVHVGIRAWLTKTYGDDVAQATRIQYGGSVTPDTVDELMSKPDIDGCLVGGASLLPEKFGPIMNFKEL